MQHLLLPTFLGQIQLFELCSLLVKLGLQLLLETDELIPLLLQSNNALLKHLWWAIKIK